MPVQRNCDNEKREGGQNLGHTVVVWVRCPVPVCAGSATVEEITIFAHSFQSRFSLETGWGDALDTKSQQNQLSSTTTFPQPSLPPTEISPDGTPRGGKMSGLRHVGSHVTKHTKDEGKSIENCTNGAPRTGPTSRNTVERDQLLGSTSRVDRYVGSKWLGEK